MATMKPMDYSRDMENHPLISQLLRTILHADPLVIAEGSTDDTPYVIVGGPNEHFTFTKTATGYTVEKTK